MLIAVSAKQNHFSFTKKIPNAIKMCAHAVVAPTLLCVCLQVYSQQHQVDHVDDHTVSTSFSDSADGKVRAIVFQSCDACQTRLPQYSCVDSFNGTRHTVRDSDTGVSRNHCCTCMWALLSAVMLGCILSAPGKNDAYIDRMSLK